MSKKNKKSKNLLVVKIGNDERPASPEDIREFKRILGKELKWSKKFELLITHHAVQFEIWGNKKRTDW